jgi:hypothetical protein
MLRPRMDQATAARPDRASTPGADGVWRGALAWAAVAALSGASVAGLEPNLLEEGIVVHAAERMAAGEHLYRDIVLFTAPLPYELLALLFRSVGPELLLARGFVVALQAAAAALIFACPRTRRRQRWPRRRRCWCRCSRRSSTPRSRSTSR